MAEKHHYILPSGEVVELTPTMYDAIMRLQEAIERVASGITRSLHLLECDGKEGLAYITSLDGEGLDAFARILREQAKVMDKYGTLWDGNAPMGNRSFGRH